MTDTDPLRPTHPGTGALLAGRYLLGPRIGRGGMAEVFRAEDYVLHRPVAVKVFRFDTAAGDDRRRVDAEVRTLASLRHPGLVTVFDAGTEDEPNGDGTPFLVMELIAGPTLGQRLASGPLGLEQTAQLGAALAATLGYVHASGVVHRDVKPANILLDTPSWGGGGFAAKLTDFGISRLLDSARLTTHGMTVGTANYLSPEQAEAGTASPASDVYSLGLVLLECLTGQLVYPGVGIEAALARLQRPPDIPAEYGPAWAQLLSAMTERDPAARPSTEDVTAALTGLGASGLPDVSGVAEPGGGAETAVLSRPGSATGSTTLMNSFGSARRTLPRRVIVAAAAVSVLLIVIVVALSTRGSGKSGGPAPGPSYPSVSGQLGTHLKQLEGTLP